jgi:hypothetical protein
LEHELAALRLEVAHLKKTSASQVQDLSELQQDLSAKRSEATVLSQARTADAIVIARQSQQISDLSVKNTRFTTDPDAACIPVKVLDEELHTKGRLMAENVDLRSRLEANVDVDMSSLRLEPVHHIGLVQPNITETVMAMSLNHAAPTANQEAHSPLEAGLQLGCRYHLLVDTAIPSKDREESIQSVRAHWQQDISLMQLVFNDTLAK